MEENIKRLEQQIDLLINQYKHSKTINKARIILSSIKGLLELYKDVTNKEYKKINEIASINPYYYQKYVEYNNQKRNIFIKEFIKNRDYHYKFISDIIDKFDFLNYEYDEYSYIQSKKYTLDSILKNYNKNFYDTYERLKCDNRIFLTNKKFYCATTTYDWYNNIEFISINYKEKEIENLVSLIHELGHIEDEIDLIQSKRIDYSYKTIFSEVNSLYREKEFYDYLLENKINLEEIKSEVLLEPHTILENLMNVLIYCKIPKNYINIETFKEQWIEKGLKNIRFGPDIFLENYECIELYDAIIYSYGELLSTYFLENNEKYAYFREKRYDLLSPKIIMDLDITSEDITKSLYKKYEKYK